MSNHRWSVGTVIQSEDGRKWRISQIRERESGALHSYIATYVGKEYIPVVIWPHETHLFTVVES